jgi:hypothetical protein
VVALRELRERDEDRAVRRCSMWAWGWTLIGVALAALGVDWWLARREKRRAKSAVPLQLVRGPEPLEEPKVLARMSRRT